MLTNSPTECDWFGILRDISLENIYFLSLSWKYMVTNAETHNGTMRSEILWNTPSLIGCLPHSPPPLQDLATPAEEEEERL